MVEVPVAFSIYITNVALFFISKYSIQGVQKRLAECATIGFLMIFVIFYLLEGVCYCNILSHLC